MPESVNEVIDDVIKNYEIPISMFAKPRSFGKKISRITTSANTGVKIDKTTSIRTKRKRRSCSEARQSENPYKKQYKSYKKIDIDEILTFDELDATIKKESEAT